MSILNDSLLHKIFIQSVTIYCGKKFSRFSISRLKIVTECLYCRASMKMCLEQLAQGPQFLSPQFFVKVYWQHASVGIKVLHNSVGWITVNARNAKLIGRVGALLHLIKCIRLKKFYDGILVRETQFKKVWPRWDSNIQSSDPKSDAISIRPRGRRWEIICYK